MKDFSQINKAMTNTNLIKSAKKRKAEEAIKQQKIAKWAINMKMDLSKRCQFLFDNDILVYEDLWDFVKEDTERYVVRGNLLLNTLDAAIHRKETLTETKQIKEKVNNWYDAIFMVTTEKE